MKLPIPTALEYLNKCNIQYNKNCTRNEVTWRWPIREGEIVPVIVGKVPDEYRLQRAYVDQAIVEINRRLGTELLREAEITADMPYGYIRISFGTAFEPEDCEDPCECRANVSQAKGKGERIVPCEYEYFASPPAVWLNIGNGNCEVELEHVIHEFGHALGLIEHFPGFGDKDVISSRFWEVLATLYGNAPGTALDDLRLVAARP